MADGRNKKMENMKKFFLLMMACGVALWGRAQQGTDVLMATLQHGDEVSVYYGKTALEEAYKVAADSGDVITLSAGRFTAPNPTPYRSPCPLWGTVLCRIWRMECSRQ